MGKKIACWMIIIFVFVSGCRSIQLDKQTSKNEPTTSESDQNLQKSKAVLNSIDLDVSLDLEKTENVISDRDVKKWIDYLAQEKMSGRRAGSSHEVLMQMKIEEAFKKWGLLPAFKDGYRHAFNFVDRIEIGTTNSLVFKTRKDAKIFPKDQKLKISQEYEPYIFSRNGTVSLSNITFVGYGISAPAMGKQPRYNSYENIDVKNKWVVFLDGTPKATTAEFKEQLLPYARIEHKVLMAAKRGALGVLLIGVSKNIDLIRYNKNLEGVPLPLPVVVLGRDLANDIFNEEDLNLNEIENKVSNSEEMIAFDFSELQAQATVDLVPRIKKAYNIVGKIKGSASNSSSIIVGAHGDHLGVDPEGRSFTGADDNASGVAAVMELAQDLSKLKQLQPKKFQKDIYFAIWSAEEFGNLGSAEFIKDSSVNFSAALNFDMIGRYRGSLYVQGVASAQQWNPLLKESEIMSGLRFEKIDDPYAPTDAVSFYEAQIPSLNFYTGAHSDYHSVSDTADKVNVEGVRRTAIAAKFILLQLSAQKSDFLKYQDYHLFFKKQVQDRRNKKGESQSPSLQDSF